MDPIDKDQKGGQDGDGGDGTSSATPTKTTEQRLQEMEDNAKKMQATLQSTQEELKRVNGLNSVLMQRMKSSNPDNGGGMDVSRTAPIKLKRDFSSMDPAADPARFATELVLETAEQVSEVMMRTQEVQRTNAELRRAFYERNKDLVGWEIEVGHFSNEVQSANPNLPFDQAAEEIAKRTREYIKTRGSADPDGTTPPHALPPGGNPVKIKPPTGGGPVDFNPDKAYEEDMKDYAKMRNAEREKLIGTPGKA